MSDLWSSFDDVPFLVRYCFNALSVVGILFLVIGATVTHIAQSVWRRWSDVTRLSFVALIASNVGLALYGLHCVLPLLALFVRLVLAAFGVYLIAALTKESGKVALVWLRRMSSVSRIAYLEYRNSASHSTIVANMAEIETLRALVRTLQSDLSTVRVAQIRERLGPVASPLHRGSCAVCLGKKPLCALVPCGHVAVCVFCSAGHEFRVCPICCRPCDRVVQLYDVCSDEGGQEDDDKDALQAQQECNDDDDDDDDEDQDGRVGVVGSDSDLPDDSDSEEELLSDIGRLPAPDQARLRQENAFRRFFSALRRAR